MLRSRDRLRAGGITAANLRANLRAPEITGRPTVGLVLTKVPGVWTNTPTVTQQWKADGVAIGGATGTTYTLLAGQENAVITVTETADYGGGSTLTATSDATAAVITEATAVAAVQTDLTAAGVWAKLDAIWILQSTEALSKVNLKNPGTYNLAVAAGTPTWTAGSGFRSAAGGRWTSGFNPTTAPSPKFTQDSNHLFMFCATDVANTLAAMGAETVALNPRTTNNTDYNFPTRHRNGIAATPVNTGGFVDALGTHSCTRSSSTKWWTVREGEYQLEHTQTSQALGNFELYFGSYNAATPQTDTTRYYMAGAIGSALTQAEALAEHKATTKCLVRLGHVTPRIEAPVTGVPRSNEVTVAADVRWADDNMRVRLVVTTDADTTFANPVFRGDPVDVDWAGAHCPVQATATGLAANTAYRWRFEILGFAPNSTDNPVCTFTTAPAAAAAFSFALVSCSNVSNVTTTAATGQAELVFEALAPLTSLKFWRHLGDFSYDDNTDGDDAYYLAQLAADPTYLKRSSRYYVRAFLKYAFTKAINAFLPLHLIPDDHDFVFNDYTNDTAIPGSTYATCATAANTALIERIPRPANILHSTLHAGYQDYGPKVRFLTMDTRTQRRTAGTGSLLGNASDTYNQVQAIKDQVTQAASDGIKILFIECSCTWTGSANDGFGFDADWAVERTSLSDHFKTVLDANPNMKIVMLVGDMHRVSVDDGTNCAVHTTGAARIPRFIEIVGSPLNSTVLYNAYPVSAPKWNGADSYYAPGTLTVDYAQLVTTIEVDAANEQLTIKQYDCSSGSAVLQATYNTTDLTDW